MSQSAGDGPGRMPPWEAFGGGDAPVPGPELAALLGSVLELTAAEQKALARSSAAVSAPMVLQHAGVRLRTIAG